MAPLIVVAILVAVAVWAWRQERDPLIYLIPPALAFPPLLAYGGRTVGWPTAWLSTKVALAMCLTLWAGFRLAKSDFRWNRLTGSWFIVPWVLLVLLSAVWVVLGPFGGDVAAISNEFARWALPLLAALVLAGSIHSDADIESATRVLVWTAVGVAGYTVLQGLALLGDERFVPSAVTAVTEAGRRDMAFAFYRVYGTFPNLGPIQLAFFLLIPAVLAFGRVAGTRGRARVAWGIAALAITAIIVATHSRGVQLGLASALITLALLRRSRAGLVGVVLGLVVAAVIFASTPVGQGFKSIYASGQWDPDIEGRFGEWRAILAQFPDYPLGRGFGSWARASQHIVGITDPFLSDIGAGRAADAQWMLELPERGLPGLLALALMMGGLLVTTHRKASRLRGTQRDIVIALGAAFAGWSVALLSGDSLMYDSIAGSFWYAVALTVAAAREEPKRASSVGEAAVVRAT